MGVWVKIREECLFFIWFCFIGVLECSMSLSAACVCLGPSKITNLHHLHSWMVEFQRFPLFSVLFEGITVPNCSCESPKSVYSLWTNPPNTSCSDHYSPVICQLLALALWHHASVPCFHGLVHFSCLAGSCNISSPTTHDPTRGLRSDWLFWVTFSQNHWKGYL